MTSLLLTEPAVARVKVARDTSDWDNYLAAFGPASASLRPRWLTILTEAFGHRTFALEARDGDRLAGVLPLAFVESRLFGRYLCSLPYLNTGGVAADSPDVACRLTDAAVDLANELDVKHLELRHEEEIEHPALTQKLTSKVHLRLPLPATSDELRDGFKSKLRSQIKKPVANPSLTTHFGGPELLPEFYRVFCANMRDLGTPPYSPKLFAAILSHFPEEAEFAVIRHNGDAVSAALLIHGPSTTQVPSASTLRSANPVAANMLLYWRVLERAIERGQRTFDFGRSTVNAGTYHFKKQWGAVDHPATWQYFVRKGEVGDLRPESGKYALMVKLWKKLPIAVTRWIGPGIVRGIP